MVHAFEHAIHLARIAFAHLGIVQHKWVVKYFLQRNVFVDQQRVARRQEHHQGITPHRLGDDAVTSLVGERESRVVQVTVQAFDLL
ncbi:hypothetical protein D3C71_1558200 [compost metagenome]